MWHKALHITGEASLSNLGSISNGSRELFTGSLRRDCKTSLEFTLKK
jgi:hypothetical protein